MKNIIIKHAMALVALAIATVTLVSAGISSVKSSKLLAGPVWYEIQVVDPELGQIPNNLKITAIASTPPQEEAGDFCGTKNHFDSCMVRLNTDNLTNPNEVLNLTISQANSTKNAPVSPESGGDGYARSTEEE